MKINKAVMQGVLPIFLVTSIVPANGALETLTENEAMFGWCRLKRIKKKTKALVKSIEEFKRGEKTVEEVTYEIASIKRDANKVFKKNYKVHEIIQLANRKIEEYFYSLLDDETISSSDSFISNVVKCEGINIAEEILERIEPIKIFLSDMYCYEDLEDHIFEDSADDELPFLKDLNYSRNNYSDDPEDVEAKIVFAYVSIFCGCLLMMIPTGISQYVGGSLIGGGLYVLSEDYVIYNDERNRTIQN